MTTVLSNRTSWVCASPATVASILHDFEPFGAVREALQLVGLAEVLSLERLEPNLSRTAEAVAFSLKLRTHEYDQVEVTWHAAVSRWGHGDTALTVSVRGEITEAGGEAALVAVWLLIGPILDRQTARAVRVICELAEENEAT
jgi:hypothetical protein